MKAPDVTSSSAGHAPDARAGGGGVDLELVAVGGLRAAGDTGTCLRPLGLCELGGSCESCWYRPDHPRFKKPT